MDLELPPEMPNGLGGDDEDEDEDDDLDDSYDLTGSLNKLFINNSLSSQIITPSPLNAGLSDKLHSIPTEALHEAPREVKIGRDVVGGDGEICLDEMGRPKGFDADAVVAKSLRHSNGLISPKAKENGVEVDHDEPSEVHDSHQASAVQSEVSPMPKGVEEKVEEIPQTVPEVEVKEQEESENSSQEETQVKPSVEENDKPEEFVGCFDTNDHDSPMPKEAEKTGKEIPQSAPEVEKEHEKVKQRDDFEANSQEEVEGKQTNEEIDTPGEPVQESVECSADNDDDDDDFGDFDSAFAPSNNVIAAPDIPTGFPAPPISGQSSNWSASFVSNVPSNPKAKVEDDEEDDFGDFGDFTNPSLVTATSDAAVADPDPSLESLQQILDSVGETTFYVKP